VGIQTVIGLLWSLLLIGATHRLANVLRKENVIAWMDRVTGMIFVLIALRLALNRR